MIGQNLGRYQIVEKIGQGGMGIVYRAYDERLDRDVALKVLPQGALSDGHARSRFQKEAITLAKLNHPNIAAVHDFDSQEGIDFLVIEYVPGTTLSETLSRGPLTENEIGALGTQLCDGLAAAHLRGVIHRDLKPANLRITPECQLKILDFGLARLLKPAGETDLTQSLSQDQGLAGTIPYMSPEQLRGEPPDFRSDIYSVGVVLYEMATGHRPYCETNSVELISAILHDTPVAPSSLNHQVSSQLDTIIFKTIDKSPQNRYQRADELSGDLGRLGLIQPVSSPRKFNLKIQLWPILAVLSLAVVICVLILGFAWTPRKIWSRLRGTPTTKDGPVPIALDKLSVAILPFSVSGDAPFEYLAVGLRESLYWELTRLNGVRLSSLKEIDGTIQRDPGTPFQIARNQGSNFALSGTIEKREDEISISLCIDDATLAKRVWTSVFAGSKDDLFQLESKMVTGIVGALHLELTSSELGSVTSHPTVDPHAYELYLRGRVAAREGDAGSALEFYNRALEKDPNFALALGGAAMACESLSKIKKGGSWADQAIHFAQQAERVTDNPPEVDFWLGYVYESNGRKAEAIAAFKRGLQLAPNENWAELHLGYIYLESGQEDEASAVFKKAIDGNPNYWVNHRDLAVIYYSAGENEKALSELQQVTRLQPANGEGWANVATAELRMGKIQESIMAYQKSVQLDPTYMNYMFLGNAYVVSKQYPQAIEALDKSVELGPNQENARGSLADAYRYSGQNDKANENYDKAIALALHDLKLNPKDANTMGDIAIYCAKEGDSKRAMEFIQHARGMEKKDAALLYDQAIVESLAGKPSDAIRSLGEALSKGYVFRDTVLDPDLQILRNRPEFEQLWEEYTHKNR